MKPLDQLGATDGVDHHCSITDRATLEGRAIAMPRDLQPNHTPTIGLIQDLAIARLAAQIRDDQGVAVVVSVDRSQRARPPAAIEVLRKFLKVEQAPHFRLKRTAAADHGCGAVAAATNVMM